MAGSLQVCFAVMLSAGWQANYTILNSTYIFPAWEHGLGSVVLTWYNNQADSDSKQGEGQRGI